MTVSNEAATHPQALEDGARVAVDTARVILLDEWARPIGSAAKLEAHQAPGYRHLAFSVLLRDGAGRVLLQRRADTKYHFAGLWANSCCSHPEPGEPLEQAVHRRVTHELGLGLTGALQARGGFWYRAEDPVTGLIEHEYDVVFVADVGAGKLNANPGEVSEVAWFDQGAAIRMASESADCVPWLGAVLEIAVGTPTSPGRGGPVPGTEGPSGGGTTVTGCRPVLRG